MRRRRIGSTSPHSGSLGAARLRYLAYCVALQPVSAARVLIGVRDIRRLTEGDGRHAPPPLTPLLDPTPGQLAREIRVG